MAVVDIECRDGVLNMVLNRPERRNAMTGEMYTLLADNFQRANQDPNIRSICLSGAGRGFCAGNDLMDFMNDPDLSENAPVRRFLTHLTRCEVPIVVAVHGAAIGVGTTLMLHCDLIYATPTAKFGLPFVNLGLVPEAASSLLLPRIMGHARAAELILLGETFSAQKAKDYGLINDIIEADQLLEKAQTTAMALAQKAPQALKFTRALLKKATQNEIDQTMISEIELFTAQIHGAEAKEAFSAFFEKRSPDFSKT